MKFLSYKQDLLFKIQIKGKIHSKQIVNTIASTNLETYKNTNNSILLNLGFENLSYSRKISGQVAKVRLKNRMGKIRGSGKSALISDS